MTGSDCFKHFHKWLVLSILEASKIHSSSLLFLHGGLLAFVIFFAAVALQPLLLNILPQSQIARSHQSPFSLPFLVVPIMFNRPNGPPNNTGPSNIPGLVAPSRRNNLICGASGVNDNALNLSPAPNVGHPFCLTRLGSLPEGAVAVGLPNGLAAVGFPPNLNNGLPHSLSLLAQLAGINGATSSNQLLGSNQCLLANHPAQANQVANQFPVAQANQPVLNQVTEANHQPVVTNQLPEPFEIGEGNELWAHHPPIIQDYVNFLNMTQKDQETKSQNGQTTWRKMVCISSK